MDSSIFFYGIIIAGGLGLIPAFIAQKKGYSFVLWWFYGWMLFIVAIIHVNLIPDRNPQQAPPRQYYRPPTVPNNAQQAPTGLYDQPPATPYMVRNSPDGRSAPPYRGQSAADELKKYKELLDQGVITAEEFQTKKEQLLKLL